MQAIDKQLLIYTGFMKHFVNLHCKVEFCLKLKKYVILSQALKIYWYYSKNQSSQMQHKNQRGKLGLFTSAFSHNQAGTNKVLNKKKIVTFLCFTLPYHYVIMSD